jgi:diguanylate cyclase (GGDEF)-like protein
MQPSPLADPPAVQTAGVRVSSTRLDPSRSLGLALALRAEECSELTNTRLRAYPWVGPEPSAAYAHRVRGINWFATVLVARWVGFGVHVADEEMAYIGERGEMAATEQLSIVNITRAYLIWRDTVLELLSEEAARLNTPRDVLASAVRVVRASADAGQVQVSRAYDTCLLNLARELAVERETLLHLALHDPLTGLPNRMLLYDRINQAVFAGKRNGATFGVLAIDLDGFKSVNDSLGHSGGDTVLKRTSARLVAAVRETDTVARLGGDEFVVLLPGVSAETAHGMAAQLRDVLEQTIEVDGNAVIIGASIGVSVYPDNGVDVHTLLSAADQTMYIVKRARKPRS